MLGVKAEKRVRDILPSRFLHGHSRLTGPFIQSHTLSATADGFLGFSSVGNGTKQYEMRAGKTSGRG